MTQYGLASVVGADGTVAYNGAAAIAAFADSITTEQRATVEEFMDGFGEIIGFRKADERDVLTLTIVPKSAATGSGAIQSALGALVFPAIPSKVTFTPHANLETTAKALYGDPAGSPAGNEYIYTGGARRTMVRQQAALELVCWRPKSSSQTVAQLLTVAS